MVAGVDIWLNTPLPPNEASGTSGMKAAHNGVPHFSTLDGWWIEGLINKKTGWAIGQRRKYLDIKELNKKDAESLYYKLENKILPRYYNFPERWQETMRYTIAVNASYFNTERMLQQYIQAAYL
jgi:starch phosphorylase